MIMSLDKEIKLPWWNKYTLTIEEAALYFGVGEIALRKFINEHPDAQFILKIGSKTLIKKSVFEKYIDEQLSVL